MSSFSKKANLLERQDFRCWYCGYRVYSADDWELEHQVPRSCGGDNSPENIVVACRKCNRRKRNRTVEEYAYALADQLDVFLYEASALVMPFAERDPIARAIQDRIEAVRDISLTKFKPMFYGEPSADGLVRGQEPVETVLELSA